MAKRTPLVGYIGSDNATVKDGHGNVIGTCKAVSTWRTPLSNPYSSTRSAYRATIEGKSYHGQGYGRGMSICLYEDRK